MTTRHRIEVDHDRQSIRQHHEWQCYECFQWIGAKGYASHIGSDRCLDMARAYKQGFEAAQVQAQMAISELEVHDGE